MNKKTIKDIGLTNKSILIRVDYNVSTKNENGVRKIVDDTRIVQSIPTIQYILSQNPKKLILMSHLGDPKKLGELEFSLDIVSQHLSKLLGKEIIFISNYLDQDGLDKINECINGEIIMLENVRYYKEEELNDLAFAKKLARLADVFVNDAFGSSHRAHASVVGVAEFLPAVAGLLLEKEIVLIGDALENPQFPFVAVLGGAKATTKIPMIEKLMKKADFMLLGGGVANTFLKAMGYEIGKSIYSPESLRIARNLIWKATKANTRIFMPSDLIVGNLGTKTMNGVVDINEIPIQFQALDIGPKTQKEYANVISGAKTIIWNGPMGANEITPFAKGTEIVFTAIANNKRAISIVGGGDTLTSIRGKKNQQNITHISTGGGAMLEFIEKGELPGIAALNNK